MITQVHKKLVFGLGTGRCGTLSLAHLLNSQTSADVTHECKPHLTWRFNESLLSKKLEQLTSRQATVVGDVALYFLPYVERILSQFSDAKFVCLRRDREQVIKSFLQKAKKQNHWVDHDGTRWKPSPTWDPCFPKYNVRSKKAAIGIYWDDYYREATRLATKYPSNFQIFDLKSTLNTAQGQQEICRFLGFWESVQPCTIEVRENQGSYPSLSSRLRRTIHRVVRKVSRRKGVS